MQLLINPVDHFKFLTDALTPTPERIFITSYGLYAGILPDGRDTAEWGPRFKSQTRELLESMRKIKNVQMLIGLYEFKACKKPTCMDCEWKYALDLIRHMNHAEKFPEFQWRITSASHIKCALFFYKDRTAKGIAGSRNFTDSSWEDVTVTLDTDGITKLDEHLQGMWSKAKILSDSHLGEVLKDQGISEKALDSITAGL